MMVVFCMGVLKVFWYWLVIFLVVGIMVSEGVRLVK